VKKSIKILILLCLVHCMPTITMEQAKESTQLADVEENLIDILPTELLEIILLNVYFDVNACDGYDDIPEAICPIKQKLPSISKNIRLVCKAFNLLNDSISKRSSLKDMLKKFYRSLLIKIKDFEYFPELENFLKTGKDNGIISKQIKVVRGSPHIGIKSERVNQLIDMLLFYGADVNSKDDTGNAAIHEALVLHNHEESARNMIIALHGADVNSNKYLAKEIIIKLLAHGADVNLQDKKGYTVFHYALHFHRHGPEACAISFRDGSGCRTLEIIKILLEHGADLNIKNDRGDTARAVAERLSFSDIAEFVKKTL